MKYRYGSWFIESKLALPPLKNTVGNHLGADFNFALATSLPFDPDHIEWDVEYSHPDGRGVLLTGSFDGMQIIKFLGVAHFIISNELNVINCVPEPHVPEHTIVHLLLDQVLPRLSSLLGIIALHCSAVVADEGLLVFLGESGAGKSTLASSFGQQGLPVFSDDIIMLEVDGTQVYGLSPYSSVRLRADSLAHFETFGHGEQLPVAHFNQKVHVSRQDDIDSVPRILPFKGIFRLDGQAPTDTEETTEIRDLAPITAFRELTKARFHFYKPDQALISHEWDVYGKLIDTVPIYELRYIHDYDLLPHVHATILDHVSA